MLKGLHAERRREKSDGKIFGILFVTAFVMVFGVVGVTLIHSVYVKEKTYSGMTTGTVVDYNDYSVGHDHKYAPIVEYRVEDQIFVCGTNIRFNFRPFDEGAYVSVYYNPESPGESYIKEYDLKATYKLGAIFLLVSVGITIVAVLFAVIGRTKLDKGKREDMQVKIFLSVILLFMFTVFSFLAGLGKTICIFAVMGLFALYGIHRDKHKNQKEH